MMPQLHCFSWSRGVFHRPGFVCTRPHHFLWVVLKHSIGNFKLQFTWSLNPQVNEIKSNYILTSYLQSKWYSLSWQIYFEISTWGFSFSIIFKQSIVPYWVIEVKQGARRVITGWYGIEFNLKVNCIWLAHNYGVGCRVCSYCFMRSLF